MSILYNPDEDDQDDKSPEQPQQAGNPFVIVWLFAAVTTWVTLPALSGMALGIYIGDRMGQRQTYAVIGTLLGLAVAAWLVARYAKQINQQ